MINLEPLYREGRNCYEDILASVTKFYSNDYYLIYCNSWSFDFIPSESETLGSCLKSHWGNIEQNMLKFTGIKAEEALITDAQKAYQIIIDNINQNRAVSFTIKMSCCYWHNWSKDKNSFNTATHIITAYDYNESKGLICMDCQPVFKDIEISKELFCKGFLNKLVLFDSCKSRCCDREVLFEALVNQIERLSSSTIYENSFCAQEAFIESLRHIDLKKECNDISEKDFWKSPIFSNLFNLGLGRKQFALYAKHLDLLQILPTKLNIADRMEKCGENYLKARNMLIKARLVNNPNNMINQAADILQATSAEEKKVFEAIQDIVRSNKGGT